MEPLTFKEGIGRAENGDVGVIMLVQGRRGVGENDIAFNYFEYVVRFLDPPSRIEWDADTAEAVLPKDTADYLVKANYARHMNGTEVRAYNRKLDKPEKKGEPS